MNHNDDDNQQTDSGNYERSARGKLANLSISNDKGHDQSAHDMRGVRDTSLNREPMLNDQHPPHETTQSREQFKEFELLPTYRGMAQAMPSLPGSIGGPQSLQTIGNDILNTKAGGVGASVERVEHNCFTSVTPPAPPATTTMNIMTAISPPVKVTTKVNDKSSKSRSKRPYSVPNEPFYTSPSTNFWTDLNPGDIKARVEVMFNDMPGVSYEFFYEKCRWEGVYLVSSMRCKFELNVYKRSSGGNVVEGNRLSGDSIAFIAVYQAVYNLFAKTPAVTSTWNSFGPSPPAKRKTVAKDEVASIKAVTAMAVSPVGEAKVNAAQIFANMARDPSKHSFLVDNGCVPLLVQLMKCDFQACDQFAAIALTQLSEYAPCRQLLSQDKEFLEILLPLCSSNGNYNSTEKRRKCAQLLANISNAEKGAEHVVTSVDKRHVQTFLENIDTLKDMQQRQLAFLSQLPLAACTY